MKSNEKQVEDLKKKLWFHKKMGNAGMVAALEARIKKRSSN